MNLLVLIVLVASSACESANILGIFNYPSYSHQIVFQKIVKDLSARGHHLTILTVNHINENYPNVTEIFLDGSYDENHVNYAETKEEKWSMLSLFSAVYQTTVKRSRSQLSHPEVRKLIDNSQNEKFDLILLEYLYQHPLIYFAEIYDCPIVAVSSMEVTSFVHSVMGNYVNFMIHPEIFFKFEHGKLSLLERIESLVLNSVISLAMIPGLSIVGHLTRHYFPNVTASIPEVEHKRIEFLLQNANPILGATRPVTHNTIMLGNLHIEPPKPVENDLLSILDTSINGVIYVSFGSNIKTAHMSRDSMSIFVNTFKRLKYDILWKLDGHHEELLENATNIFVSKWYPQSDLLAHKNVKLFITHCGLMSLEEAIDREVPMVAVPFLFDQHQNAYTVRNEKIGVHVEYDSITEDVLYDAILEATKSEYKENIRQLKALMYDFPMKSRDKAVWWIEYALRNKGRNKLKYQSARIPFHQKYCLDILLLLIFILITVKKIFYIVNSIVRRKIKSE